MGRRPKAEGEECWNAHAYILLDGILKNNRILLLLLPLLLVYTNDDKINTISIGSRCTKKEVKIKMTLGIIIIIITVAY